MKIIGIEVYGFGKLENVQFDLRHSNIHVFYGDNEAGKSTLMSFVHCMLFGFPTKQQTELRYEPKSGMKYGGRLILMTEEHGKMIVERIAGKATGDVTVYLSDGTKAGEEFLQSLFHGMDKSVYQGIYSFDIHGLQNVQRLDSNHIGKYLFSSGAVGTDALLTTEQKLTKELELLFKPNGKKPAINSSIVELREAYEKVNDWKEKNKTYQLLREEQQLIETKLKNIAEEMEQVQREIRRVEKIISIIPLIREKEVNEIQLEQLGEYEPFPVDGMLKLEQLQSQLKPLLAQEVSLIEKRAEIQRSMTEMNRNFDLLNNKNDIEQMINKKWKYSDWLKQEENLRESIVRIDEDLLEYKQSFLKNKHNDEFLEMDTSILAKEEIKNVSAIHQRHLQEKNDLDDRFSRAKEELEDNETKLRDLQKKVLSHEERKRLEDIQKSFQSADSIEREKSYLEQTLMSIDQKLKNSKHKEVKTKKTLTTLGGMATVLFVSLIMFFMYQKQWVESSIVAIIFTMFISVARLISRPLKDVIKELKHDRQNILNKLNEFESMNSSANSVDLSEVHAKLSMDSQLQQLVEIEKATLSQKERQYDRILKKFEKWESEGYEVNAKVMSIQEKYGFPSQVIGEQLRDAFLLVENVKALLNEKKKVQNKLDLLIEDLQSYEEEVAPFLLIQALRGEELLNEIDALERRFRNQEKNEREYFVLTEKMNELDEQLSYVKGEITFLQNEWNDLMSFAKVTSEDEYRLKGKAYGASQKIIENIKLIEGQLSRSLEDGSEINLHLDYENMLVTLEQQLNELKQTESNYQSKLSKLTYEMKELEEGGTYSDLFHSFQLNKANIQEQARRWAVLSVARSMLSNTVQYYQSVRLPQLLHLAEKYMKSLTDEQYVKLHTTGDESYFTVERIDGVRFSPSELSQATAEQVYVAIRFALAKTMHPTICYPFIIDDSFVNFDSKRITRVIELLTRISESHQILFFTCHEHLLEKFKDANIIQLENGVVEQC
ncbi:AAA family ATPase [Bacillus timonensis]|nr:AAA family ATPase [Bacillus timonensis]